MRSTGIRRRAIKRGALQEYQAEETKLMVVDAFVKSKPLISELLIHLGQTLPKNIALDKFDVRGTNGTEWRRVRGAPDQASGLATNYIEQLKTDKELLTRFEDITTIGSGRNPTNGRITLDVLLRLKAVGKDGKKP